ncbi:MAG: universal stress protein [Acidobacteriota bacterium]
MKRSKGTKPFRSVLCPVDFSKPAEDAIRHARGLTRRSGGRLTVLFVNDPLLLAAAAAVYHRRREFLERARTELERFVDRSLGTSRARRGDVVCMVAAGDPAKEILRAAARVKSDVIVMGTHGPRGVAKLFFGSTAEQVIRQSPVPVLAVPQVKSAGRSTRTVNGLPTGFTRVIAPLDLDGDWVHDVSRAADVARAFDASLLLVYVVPQWHLPAWFRSTLEPQERQRAARGLEILEKVSATLPAHLESACHVGVGDPADEIAALAATGTADVVVMTLQGDDRVFARRGATAYRVLTHAAAPVLALHRFATKRKAASSGAMGRVRQVAAAVGDAVAETLEARDQMEMGAVDAVLGAASPRKPVRRRPSPARRREF